VLDTRDEERSLDRDHDLVSLHFLDVRNLIFVLVDTAIERENNQIIGTDEVPDDPVVLRRVPNPGESRPKQLTRLVREMLSSTPHFG
jgi:hypothetical protein